MYGDPAWLNFDGLSTWRGAQNIGVWGLVHTDQLVDIGAEHKLGDPSPLSKKNKSLLRVIAKSRLSSTR